MAFTPMVANGPQKLGLSGFTVRLPNSVIGAPIYNMPSNPSAFAKLGRIFNKNGVFRVPLPTVGGGTPDGDAVPVTAADRPVITSAPASDYPTSDALAQALISQATGGAPPTSGFE